MYQLSIEDIERRNSLALQPGRTAFIDECGNRLTLKLSELMKQVAHRSIILFVPSL